VNEVAGVQPSVDDHFSGLFGFPPVFDHDGVALNNDFAGDARCHIAAVLVDDQERSRAKFQHLAELAFRLGNCRRGSANFP